MLKPFELYMGEALEVLRRLPDESVDAVITDPPYSSGGQSLADRTRSTNKKYVLSNVATRRPDFSGDNRDQRSFAYWSTLWLSECLRVARPSAPLVCFSDWRQLPTTTDAIQAGGWIWRGVAVWDKPAPRPSMGRFASSCEFMVWGSKGAMPQREAIGCLPGTYRVNVRQADKHHVTGKPTELMRHVSRICPVGGVVLDPFAGSGSTGVGALIEGRRFIGIELSDEYAAIARTRLEGLELQERVTE